MSVLTTCISAYLENKKIVFFGAGQYSNSTARNLGRRISYFCDNAPAKQGADYFGVPVCPPSKLHDEDRENTIIVVNTEYYGEITGQLIEMGFKHIYSAAYKNGDEPIPPSESRANNFLQLKADAISDADAKWLRGRLADDRSRHTLDKLIDNYARGDLDFSGICTDDPIYFNGIFQNDICGDDVYVDAGAFDGKTVADFIFYVKGKYRKIYVFEPDTVNYIPLCRDFEGCRDTVIVNAALSDRSGVASFDMRGTASSKIAEGRQDGEGFCNVKTVTLDDHVKDPVTFIKMDIEGGEHDALAGARGTIKKNKPKLAVSVYHRDDDLVKIPRLIHGMVPEYKFYLRHHTPVSVDTVLYAL